MANTFPPNPSDGMIFEASSGVFYQFSVSINGWIRLDGVEALGLATPSQAGLMSKEDFRKINELIVPPPRTALTSEDCSHIFENGIIGLRSSEEHMEINHKLKLMNKAAGDVEENVSWKIHENTFGYLCYQKQPIYTEGMVHIADFVRILLCTKSKRHLITSFVFPEICLVSSNNNAFTAVLGLEHATSVGLDSNLPTPRRHLFAL